MNSKLHEIETLHKRVLREIDVPGDRCAFLLKIYKDLVIVLSEASALHFNTLFARVSFIASRYPIGYAWSYALQIPRREIHQRELTDIQLLPILEASVQLLLVLCRAEANPATTVVSIDHLQMPRLPHHRKPGHTRKKFARVVVVEWNPDEKILNVLDEDIPDAPCVVHYSVAGINDIFSGTLELALREIGMPLILGLTDIDITETGNYVPGYIVIMPDLLLDVTSVTQVMSAGADPLAINVMDIFLPSSSNEAILTGQVANYFLDELIRDTSKSFQELFTGSFKIYPVEFVRMTDDQIKGMYNRMKVHYDNILSVIRERFPVLGIEREHCVIEPSYFSPQYGIKGRLDLFYEQAEGASASIIELKSNRPFKPNSYGLSSSNYHQTLLYDLLIQSSHGPKLKRSNYILYSAESLETLRYAVSVGSIQKETIYNRNQLVLLQYRLMRLDEEGARDLFQELDPAGYEQTKGYVKKNLENWFVVYSSLSPGEKMYFKCFTAFVTREHMLARIGSDRGDGSGGLAGLWLDQVAAKEDRYQILQGLELIALEKNIQQTTLEFRKTNRTNPLANFRAGDIAILYPYEERQTVDPTKYQLHRASIIGVDAERIVVRLRNTQIHTGQIEKIKYWNIEHDLLDSSFRSLYQSLWGLMSTDALTRQYILGLTPPPWQNLNGKHPVPDGLTTSQQAIYHEAINAGFLYLLWGPPGTGKTSIMLKSWVWYYFHHTSSRIVLLAYTNKAVDEICEALHESGPEVKEHYIRIGSRAASGESFRHRLLDQVIEPMTRRAEIKELLDRTRIFVATISSLHGKSELFNLITFDVAIMDEASQLLEPAIVGLLPRFRKSILIGDHMQLPAVSIQPEEMCRIKPGKSWSDRIGLTAMNMSYFERLYRLYRSKGWNNLIGNLFEQGRMHEEIMQFANEQVYHGLLRPVDQKSQGISLTTLWQDESHDLFKKRLIYIPSLSTLPECYTKTNQNEVGIVLAVLRLWLIKLEREKLNWTIGVVTPFRAQIAAIIHEAHKVKMNLNNVSIDTVERYQGGARDIIIMSCAVNSIQNLSKITSVNADGIDRKLNVAITRARQQFILIGIEKMLETEEGYRALIQKSALIKASELPEAELNYQPEA